MPDEPQIITHAQLGRIEVFHDPRRDEFAAAAAAAHDKAKAHRVEVGDGR